MNNAPAIIAVGLFVFCQLAAPLTTVDMDVTAATAPIIPFQPVRFPRAPRNPHIATLKTSKIFMMRNTIMLSPDFNVGQLLVSAKPFRP